MPSSVRQFVPHSRGKFIRPIGMGMSQGFKRALLPIKSTHLDINGMPFLGKGIPLLLQEDLGVSDIGGVGMKKPCCSSCAKGMPCSSKGRGFGVPPINQKLVDKLQKISLKAVDAVKKRKNVGAIF